MELYSPWVLLLLLILPVLAYLMLRKRRTAAVKFSSVTDMKSCPVSWRLRFRPILVAARLLALGFLIVALARPRQGTVLSEISTEGVAMEVVVDHSGSMQAEMDYKGQTLNRLEVVKKVFADFINGDKKEGMGGRGSDLIGLISFARYADTLCPMVLSHSVLLEFLKKTEIVNERNEDGTAIGDAIALAAARLQKCEDEIVKRRKQLGMEGVGLMNISDDFKIKSKAIILLTDGCNNTGQYDPKEAAELAKKWGIKIYTIGIGSAQGYTTMQTLMGAFKVPTNQDLDERLLKTIAKKTGAFYGRADDSESLRQIVKKINDLEKTEVKAVQYTQFAEHFGPWTWAGLLVLGFEMVASCTIFRKIP
jgi:Ca-activated chloride channel homolog